MELYSSHPPAQCLYGSDGCLVLLGSARRIGGEAGDAKCCGQKQRELMAPTPVRRYRPI